MRRFFKNFSEEFTKERLIIAAVVVLLGSLQGWTWSKRYSLIAKNLAEVTEIQNLEKEVTQLQEEWSGKQQERDKVASDLKSAYERLFEGDPTSSNWSTQISNPPEALNFMVGSDKPITHPEYPDKLAIVPTNWVVKNPSESANTLDGVLEFLHDLTTRQSKWIDLVEVLINGNEVTQTRAQFSLRLWFKKEAKS
jgi:hypothetical protein